MRSAQAREAIHDALKHIMDCGARPCDCDVCDRAHFMHVCGYDMARIMIEAGYERHPLSIHLPEGLWAFIVPVPIFRQV